MENGRGNRYEYDDEGQLTRASYRAEDPENGATTPYRNEIFQYDKLGNRKGWNYLANRGSTLFKGKNTGLNQYFSWENNYPSPPLHWGTTTNYDDDLPGWGEPARANGVLMQEGWITGFYNALNQPVGMTPTAWIGTGNWMWFGYDPLGRCVKRWVGPHAGTPPNLQVPPANTNPATYYYYDGWNPIQEGATGVPPSRVYVHGGRMDEIVASWAGGNWSQHQYDAQGNCILLTDDGGNILEQYDYDAFGYPYFYSSTGQPLSASTVGNRFLFTGREWIKELRLYDYRNRMYQPELGRFLQPDPKEFAAGDYNLYRYCHNDPVNRSDPMGMMERIMEDFRWKMNCFFDSGNSFQGSLGQYMNRSQAAVQNSPGRNPSANSQNSANARQPSAIRREQTSNYIKLTKDHGGNPLYVVHIGWKLTLLDEHGQATFGPGISIREEIKWGKSAFFQPSGKVNRDNVTKGNGLADDPWNLPFTSSKGELTTTQTISVGDQKANWDATVKAGPPGNTAEVNAQTWAPFER